MYVDCLLEIKAKNVDQTFTYKVPKNLEKKIAIGKRVNVSFGKQTLEGFILNIKNTAPEELKILDINDVVDEDIVLNEELLTLGHFIKEKTLCSLSSAYGTMLPKALKASSKTNINKKYDTYLNLNFSYDKCLNLCTSNTQKEIINLIDSSSCLLKKEASNISLSSVKTLLNKNIIKEVKKEAYRYNIKALEQDEKKVLNSEQQNVYEIIKNGLNGFNKYLIHGVTGSGKTEIYMHLIEDVINLNKSAIVLVPEISLTPQFIYNFQRRFGEVIAVLHSALSDGEKYDEWRKIMKDEVKIVIGARSSIFAPLKNLGIIIIDEEHSLSYKQESNPKYNAIDVAEERGRINNIPVVLGSATPSLERMARASKNLYELLTLKKRVNKALMPVCTIVDMAKEMKKGNSIISSLLKVEIESSISRGEQVILLLNRKGYSTIINCSNCGYTYKCPHCDITLTYYKTKNNLRCHYCGYTKCMDKLCPNCKEELNLFGLGTEKLEEIIKNEFPDLKILRMDADTTRRKNSYEDIIKKFQNHDYDILLGTQMISKGLDFPSVSLVGIISADTTLNIPDFRSGERTFELLYQASGRAGRGETLGRVVIQTFNPNNYILNCVKEQDYDKFYRYEMNIRKTLKYPPYYYLVSLQVSGKNIELVSSESKKTVKYLKDNLSSTSKILGPTTATIFKMNNIFRYNIIIKYRFDNKLISTLKELDSLYMMNNKVNLSIDMDPLSI